MNEIQKVKQAVSNYLKDNNYKILDLFYKMPCNSCSTVEDWGKNSLFFQIFYLIMKINIILFCLK